MLKRALSAALVLAMLASLFLFALPSAAVAETDVRALFLNVGKADAALLFLGDRRYLVDTGKSGNHDELSLALSIYQIERLDGVIITHTDKDHVGGLKKLLKSGAKVDMLYAAKLNSEPSEDAHPVYEASQKYVTPLSWLVAGDELDLGNGCTARVLGPLSLDETNENNNSLVLDVQTPEGRLLLTGDMETEEETELLAGGLVPNADVLKVAHHGDDDSTSKAFVLAVSPQWAVISTSSADEPDTPDSKVISRLWEVKSGVAVTQDASLGIMVTLKGGVASADKLDVSQ